MVNLDLLILSTFYDFSILLRIDTAVVYEGFLPLVYVLDLDFDFYEVWLF